MRRYQCNGLRQDLQRAERWRHAAVGLAPQGTLAVVRGVAGEAGRRCKASAARCDVAVSTAFRGRRHRFRGGAERFGGAQGDRCRSCWTRPTSWRAGRARAGWDARLAAAAGRQGEEARPLAREQVPVRAHGGLDRKAGRRSARCSPRVDAGGAHGWPSTRWSRAVLVDALLVSDGGASYPPCAAALGVSHASTQPLDGGTGSGRSCMCSPGERVSPQPVEGLPASHACRRGIATRYLDNYLSWFHLVGLAPRRQRPGLPRRCRRNKVTHTIHLLSLLKSRSIDCGTWNWRPTSIGSTSPCR